MRPWAAARCAMALLPGLACASAEAHLESTGMGPVYDGALHFLTSPEDLAAVLALALLAGLRGADHGRRALFTLPLAWLVGSLAGLGVAPVHPSPLGAASWFLILGVLVMLDARLPLAALTALAALLGLVRGFFNGSGLGWTVPSVVATAGLAAAAFVLVALVAAFVTRLQTPWARIAVRVGGSWIAASGLLLLGWTMRG